MNNMFKEMTLLELFKLYNKIGFEISSRIWIPFAIVVIISVIVFYWEQFKK